MQISEDIICFIMSIICLIIFTLIFIVAPTYIFYKITLLFTTTQLISSFLIICIIFIGIFHKINLD